MSGRVANGLGRRTARSPLTPALVFVAACAVFIVIHVESLLNEISPAALQIPAKLSAYVAAATVVALAMGLVVAFGLFCGITLRWLAGPIDIRAIARALGGGLWVFAGYAVVLAGWTMARPPLPLTRDEVLSSGASVETLMDMAWISELQYATAAAFFLTIFFLLSRVADRVNTLIALVLATAAVVALGTGLRALAALLPS